MRLIKDIWFKRRDIISEGFAQSLRSISKLVPLKIHQIPSGTKCWTWTVPEQWEVRTAYIEELGGKRLLDLKDHPLHVMSYSLPVRKVVTRKELMKHLYTNPSRPHAIPFEFKYYERDWGFCVQHERLKTFKKAKYRIAIDSHFRKGNLEVGEFTVKGKTSKTIVLVAHLCHPAMVNDDLAGVAVLVDIARRLRQRKNEYTYTILIVPETIGSIAYLSQNESIVSDLVGGIFLEMLGTRGPLALQLSRQGNTYLDRIARHVLREKSKGFREGPFRTIVENDEIVFNGPGINVPMISISRYPYPEYHTSDDNPSIIFRSKLEEARDRILDILMIVEKDFKPVRQFKGPIFLSGYGLWVDWRVNRKMNANLERIMLRLEGDQSAFDISAELGIDFSDVVEFLAKLYTKKLITKTPAL